jgi:hypothetical protein
MVDHSSLEPVENFPQGVGDFMEIVADFQVVDDVNKVQENVK